MKRLEKLEPYLKGDLKKQYKNHINECIKQNKSFFNLYGGVIDTSKFSKYNERIERMLLFVANPDFNKKILVVYHVTDNPKKVLDTIKSGKSIFKTREEGLIGDLGYGFYASANPEYWMGRSLKRYDILKTDVFTKNQINREKFRKIVIEERITSYYGKTLTSWEKEYVIKELDQFVDTGNSGYLYRIFNQPVNVKIENILKKMGIEPYKPYILEIHLKGKFLDVTGRNTFFVDLAEIWMKKFRPEYSKLYGKALLAIMLLDNGFSGMFTGSGFSTSPQIVIWKNRAIVNVIKKRKNGI